MHRSILPWHDMDRSLSHWPFSSDMSNQLSSFRPKLDVKETDKEIVVNAELPGMKKEDIHLDFNEGCLEIKGQKEEVKKRDDTTYHFTERSYGSFMRRIPLPEGVKESDIKAGMKEGVLEIHISKPERAASNKVGGVICLLNCDNERDLILLNSQASFGWSLAS